MSKKGPNPPPPDIKMKPLIPPAPPPKKGGEYSGPFGICKRNIKAGETIAMVNLLTGEVTSNNMDFLPGGKEAILNTIHLLPEGFKFTPNRKEISMKKAKEFKEIILKQFRDTSKTGWGKNEIVTRIKDSWTAFLEKQIEKGRRIL